MGALLAVTFAGAIPWVIGLLGLVGTLSLGYQLWRGGTGQALGYLREANEILRDKLDELEADRRILREQIALLETRTSLEPMVAAVIDQFVGHETRARERHAATLAVLELVARRLGPDANGG